MDGSARKRRTTASFARVADQYLDSDVHREGTDLALLVSWCAGARRVLDVACGAGHVAGALRSAGVPEVVASDATVEMLRTARDRFDVPVVAADAERLPFASDSVDAVTCRIATHHFPDPSAFVSEVARVLEPGGTFALEDNVAPEDEELARYLNQVEAARDDSHVDAKPVSWWRETLEGTGFAVEEAVTMRRELDYEAWRDRTTDTAAQREFVDDLLGRPEASSVYQRETDGDGTVTRFSNEKGLFRCRVPAVAE
ncbi:class I SAM-dependent methyltransferase [Haloarchaeobius sp. TZWWS8]|uniref:class I SAM-dependent methyltransferase n=1 Tax=Haloarchaeobius sp. TZWWS8 TaxID=3446121 RepID=UPI003EBFB9E6